MTETEQIQQYLDEIFGPGKYRAEYNASRGFFAASLDPRSRPPHGHYLGLTAAHAHAALDDLHDLAMGAPITLTEAHEFFPWIGRSTLNEWARTGKIQAHRSGKVWITSRAAIEAAIKDNRQED